MGFYSVDGHGNIFRVQSACQEYRDVNLLHYAAADVPVMGFAGAAEVFYLQVGATGIQQKGIRKFCKVFGFCDGLPG